MKVSTQNFNGLMGELMDEVWDLLSDGALDSDFLEEFF